MFFQGCDSPKIYTDQVELQPLVKQFLEFMAQIVPEMKSGCPFSASINLTNFAFDKEVVKFLPSIMPEGKFYLDQRFHTNENHTIFNLKLYFEIRPIGTVQLIKLG